MNARKIGTIYIYKPNYNMTIHNMSATLPHQITAYVVEIKYGGTKTLEHLNSNLKGTW